MGTTIKPNILELTPLDAKILYDAEETNNFIIKQLTCNEDLVNYPCVYLHAWTRTKNKYKTFYNVYVGESNDYSRRTSEHFEKGTKKETWQEDMVKHLSDPNSRHYVVYHKHFNKSMTLDIEDRLMEYVSSMHTANLVNGRPNPQDMYYPMDEADDIFSMIWHGLRWKNSNIFLSEVEIQNSAIYKASPFKKLHKKQKKAQELILRKAADAIKNGKTGQLIFVEGEAGSGKTILISSTFYKMLYDRVQLFGCEAKSYLLVNHNEQEGIFEKIAKSTGIFRNFYKDAVSKPTSFINKHNSKNLADVVFVDEAHLLLTQGRQAYTGKNMLLDIMKSSRVTIIMYDKYQCLNANQVWDVKLLESLKEQAKKEGNYIELNDLQFRMKADAKTKEWINNFTLKGVIGDLVQEKGKEYIKIFDDPNKMYEEIKKKAADESTNLSRMIATFDWEYSDKNKCDKGKYWEVNIPNLFHLPWNYEIKRFMDKKEKRKLKDLSWAEQEHTINEVGSTYTVQGSDLHYAGLIIGPSTVFRGNKIDHEVDKSKNKNATNDRTMGDKKINFGKELLRNELRVLMTRAVNGLYIYACDKDLREELLKRVK